MKTKTCSKCKETKGIGEFHKDKSTKDGLNSRCKSCKKAYQEANKDKFKAYREANKKKIAKQKKAYREANKEKIATSNRAYREANKEKIAERMKAYREANKEKIALRDKAYVEANKDKIAVRNKAYKKYKYNNDPLFKLKGIYRNSVKKAFASIGKKKNCNSIKVLGLETWQELEEYLSNQFYDHTVTGEKMTFDNHGKGENCWQIDHIVPLLTAETEEDVIRLSHYTNLQPLWGVDHIEKTASDFEKYKNS